MANRQDQQLTVRFTPEMREQLELVADREHRPMSNQVVHFVAKGLETYMLENDLLFHDTGDGLTIRTRAENPESGEFR